MTEPTISLRDVKERIGCLRDTEDRSSFYRVVELSPEERDALVEAVEAAISLLPSLHLVEIHLEGEDVLRDKLARFTFEETTFASRDPLGRFEDSEISAEAFS